MKSHPTSQLNVSRIYFLTRPHMKRVWYTARLRSKGQGLINAWNVVQALGSLLHHGPEMVDSRLVRNVDSVQRTTTILSFKQQLSYRLCIHLLAVNFQVLIMFANQVDLLHTGTKCRCAALKHYCVHPVLKHLPSGLLL